MSAIATTSLPPRYWKRSWIVPLVQPVVLDARVSRSARHPNGGGREYGPGVAHRNVLHGSQKLVAGSSLTRTTFAIVASSARTSTLTQRPTTSEALLTRLFGCPGLCV